MGIVTMNMQEQEPINVFIYRIREKGLEVYIRDGSGPEATDKIRSALHTLERLPERIRQEHCIELQGEHQDAPKAIAVEADWHELPSLRALIYEDYRVAKEKAVQHLLHWMPSGEKGAFVAIKEVLKQVMPEQYAFLKELKDVILEQNQTKYI